MKIVNVIIVLLIKVNKTPNEFIIYYYITSYHFFIFHLFKKSTKIIKIYHNMIGKY